MSEMEYEKPPEVPVPWVRAWFPRAFDSVNRFLYPRRHGFTIWWGWWMIIPGLWDLAKLVIFVTIIALLMGAQVLTAVYDMFNYRWRYNREQEAALREWAGEIYRTEHPREEYPPGVAG